MITRGSFVKTVVQFGAGAIGRGFVGQLWTEAGFEVVFVDVDPELIARLNERRSYPLRLIDSANVTQDVLITDLRAINGRDSEAVAAELANCAFAVTAVGVNVFSHLAPTIARGIEARIRSENEAPLNIICCENQVHAGSMLRAAVAKDLSADGAVRAYFESHVSFVDASVGRMVPPPTEALLREDPLLLAAEPYSELPIDGAAWIGAPIDVPTVRARTNFAGYVARKLLTHNGGHAALAYHGYLAGVTYIWEAADSPQIAAELRGFWDESGAALVAAFGFDPDEQRRHENNLLERFKNRALGDTVCRVARDPLRKLRPDDRLVGAALLCDMATPGGEPTHICRAIAAALRYEDPEDPSAMALQERLRIDGMASVLETVCGLRRGTRLFEIVANILRSGARLFAEDLK